MLKRYTIGLILFFFFKYFLFSSFSFLFQLEKHVLGSDASEGSQGSARKPNSPLAFAANEDASTLKATVRVQSPTAISVFEADKFLHDYQKEYLQKLWAGLCERIQKTSAETVSSIKDNVSLVLQSMKGLGSFDISHLEALVDTLFAKATAYDDARSQASERPTKELLSQQLNDAKDRLQKAQIDKSKGAEQAERMKAELKSIELQLVALTERQKELYKSLELQIQAHQNASTEVREIEEEINAIINTTPLDGEVAKTLKSSKAVVEATKRELRDLKPFD